MKIKRFAFVALVLISGFALARGGRGGRVGVRGYTKKNGTLVAPSVRTGPNSTKLDNFSTKGNINPLTGKEGTK